jgi:hypothetical protein
MTCRDKLLALRAKKGVDRKYQKYQKGLLTLLTLLHPPPFLMKGPFSVIQPLMERHPPGSLNGIAPSAARRERRPAPS